MHKPAGGSRVVVAQPDKKEFVKEWLIRKRW